MCIAAMMAAGTCLRAQEVTITLYPGWTWISYPNAEVLDINTALGDFVPMEGDVIKSQFSNSTYIRGSWRGGVTDFMPGWGYKYYSNRTEVVSFVFSETASQLTVATVEPTAITLLSALVGGDVTLGEGNHVFARGVCWGTDPNPDIDGEHIAGDAVAGSQSYVLHGLTSSTTYYVRAYVVTDYGLAYGEEVSFLTESNQDEHACVDLGLPSGTLWAVCNVGANAPEDYGFYFAWGETQEKDYYGWDNYQYCDGGFYDEYGDFHPYLTKYCNNPDNGYNGFIDDLTTLLPEDDAATVNWGDDWRMPTLAECEELFNNTTVTWTNQNGEDGLLFTASNGKCLFLPAAGYRAEDGLQGAGNRGRCWSSSLSLESPNWASMIYFNFAGGNYSLNSSDRYIGRTIRPVRSAPQNSVTITVLSNPTEGGIVSGGGTYEQGQSCTLTATPNVGYTFTNWTEGGEVVSTDAIYTFTVNDNRTLLANFVVSGGGNHAYVDLGLPSGLLWATCNVGAETPEDYGDYFAWGETQPKDFYDWSTYQHSNGGTSWPNPNLTKYCNNSSYGYNDYTDNLTTLLPEDDAATANWGSDWRMPTNEEWQELYQNTTQTWTTRNGVNGRLFTAPNGNSLFLPAAGCRFSSTLGYAGSYGYYWSSSLYTDYPYDAWLFSFYSVNYGMFNSYGRYCGFTVRPVCSSRQN